MLLSESCAREEESVWNAFLFAFSLSLSLSRARKVKASLRGELKRVRILMHGLMMRSLLYNDLFRFSLSVVSERPKNLNRRFPHECVRTMSVQASIPRHYMYPCYNTRPPAEGMRTDQSEEDTEARIMTGYNDHHLPERWDEDFVLGISSWIGDSKSGLYASVEGEFGYSYSAEPAETLGIRSWIPLG